MSITPLKIQSFCRGTKISVRKNRKKEKIDRNNNSGKRIRRKLIFYYSDWRHQWTADPNSVGYDWASNWPRQSTGKLFERSATGNKKLLWQVWPRERPTSIFMSYGYSNQYLSKFRKFGCLDRLFLQYRSWLLFDGRRGKTLAPPGWTLGRN